MKFKKQIIIILIAASLLFGAGLLVNKNIQFKVNIELNTFTPDPQFKG